MSEQTDTSCDEGGERRISVRRLAPTQGTTSGQIIRAVRAAMGGRPIGAISVAIVNDATITSLHERYLGEARATDVLAFDLRDDLAGERLEGEIVVSADAARRQAARFRADAARELLRYVIHGALHLSGHEDGTAAGRRRMRRAEDQVLADLGGQGKARVQRRQPRRTTRGV